MFMFHPPIKCCVLETEVDGFIGKKLLGSVISKHQHVEKYFTDIFMCRSIQFERYCIQHGSKNEDAVGTRFDAEM